MITRWVPILLLMLLSCAEASRSETALLQASESAIQVDSFEDSVRAYFIRNPEYISDGFDFPVGKPSASGYYNAQPFGQNHHMGDDWNAVTGGNSDLGDPIYAIAHGIVMESRDFGGGWGNVIRIIHRLPGLEDHYVESLYAHCDTLLSMRGDSVRRGDQIATIGNANGMYYAHLHLEIRKEPGLPLGGGYGKDTTLHFSPTWFIQSHRPIR